MVTNFEKYLGQGTTIRQNIYFLILVNIQKYLKAKFINTGQRAKCFKVTNLHINLFFELDKH